jgi:hypothetical protein
MKEFIVVLTLAGGLLFLIIFLDFIMGTSPHGLVWKALNPFRVMEAAEYLIVLLFVLIFIIKTLRSYIKMKRQGQSN